MTIAKLAPLVDEYNRCKRHPAHFVNTHVRIYNAQADASTGQENVQSVPFHLWPAQREVLSSFQADQRVIALKARQLGLTWLALAFVLWLRLFRPGSTAMLFSRREEDAGDLLRRLRWMHGQLPRHLQMRGLGRRPAGEDGNGGYWPGRDGGWVRVFPRTGGDSYQATVAIVDEADLIPDLNATLRGVKPTTDMGGKLFLISRSNKSLPGSVFKRIYRAAADGRTDWAAHFLPWHVHPSRDRAWYETQKADSLENTGSLDTLWEQYPESAEEALAPNQLDKRLPEKWLQRCRRPHPRLPEDAFPLLTKLPGVLVYELPVPGRRYAVGADPAEGNPNSDDSAFVVLDRDTGNEVACFAGKLEPGRFARAAFEVARLFNRAPVLFERNNHGHACLLWCDLQGGEFRVPVAVGPDGKPGYAQNGTTKTLLYDRLAQGVQAGRWGIRTAELYAQLASIEASTLQAPEPYPDDLAVAFALAAYLCETGASHQFTGGYA